MCRALPRSDYYEDSVTIGLLPLRPVSANVKMGEIARMELTHLRERASSTETPWRWCKEIVKGGNSERDIRNERVGLFHSGYSQGIGHCPEYGTAVPEGSGSGYAQAAAAAVIQVGPVH